MTSAPIATNIAISGASSGLGAALAREYARPGVRLFLAARRQERLEKVAGQCRRRGAEVFCLQVDVCNAQDISGWIDLVEADHDIDLLIVNAGIFSGHGKDGVLEGPEQTRRQVETNLTGAIHTARAFFAYEPPWRGGHIALVSSLAALQPQADAPVYSASKAGLLAYGQALREYLADYGVRVSIILPGHIKTAQTDIHAGALCCMISTQKAAGIIRKRLARGHSLIAFPLVPHLFVRFGRLLPWRVQALLNRPLRFHVRFHPAGEKEDE